VIEAGRFETALKPGSRKDRALAGSAQRWQTKALGARTTATSEDAMPMNRCLTALALFLLIACSGSSSSTTPMPTDRGCVVTTPGTPATSGKWVSVGGGIEKWVAGTPGTPATKVCHYGVFDPGNAYYGCNASSEDQGVTSCPEMGFVGCCEATPDYACFYEPTLGSEAKQQCSGKWLTTLP
jgi:hypothetical protein